MALDLPTLILAEPPLTPTERVVVRSYGGWSNFLFAYGLKPWNTEDAEEGLLILKAPTEEDDDNE